MGVPFQLGPNLNPRAATAAGVQPGQQLVPTAQVYQPVADPQPVVEDDDEGSFFYDVICSPGGWIIVVGGAGGVFLLLRYGGPAVWFLARTAFAKKTAKQALVGWPGFFSLFTKHGHGETHGDTNPTSPLNMPPFGGDPFTGGFYGAFPKPKPIKVTIGNLDQFPNRILELAATKLRKQADLSAGQLKLLQAINAQLQARQNAFQSLLKIGNRLLEGAGNLFPMWAADP